MDLNDILEERKKYIDYLPVEYLEYLDDLYNNRPCTFLDAFLLEYQNSDSNSFFYNITYYGFDAITMRFMEDISSIYNHGYKIYNDKNNENNEILIKKELKQIFSDKIYKMNVIIYRFVIIEVIKQSLDKLFDNFKIIFDDSMKLSLIINIVFMSVFIVGFIIFWIPFIFGENETLYN